MGEYSTGSVDNFIELLNYRVRGGDNDLGKHLESYSKIASYIPKTTQDYQGKSLKRH